MHHIDKLLNNLTGWATVVVDKMLCNCLTNLEVSLLRIQVSGCYSREFFSHIILGFLTRHGNTSSPGCGWLSLRYPTINSWTVSSPKFISYIWIFLSTSVLCSDSGSITSTILLTCSHTTVMLHTLAVSSSP